MSGSAVNGPSDEEFDGPRTMFGVRAPTADGPDERREEPFVPNRTTFGIHVLDDDDAFALGPTPKSGGDAGETMHGLALSGNPDQTMAGGLRAIPDDFFSPNSTSLGGPPSATVVGRSKAQDPLATTQEGSPAVAAKGRARRDSRANQIVSSSPAELAGNKTAVGISALTSDPDPAEVRAGRGGGLKLADDWLDDIQNFIEEKVADGSLHVPKGPEDQAAARGASAEPSTPKEDVAGFGIMRKKRKKKAGASAESSTPVATAGSADRRALQQQASVDQMRDRVGRPRANEESPPATVARISTSTTGPMSAIPDEIPGRPGGGDGRDSGDADAASPEQTLRRMPPTGGPLPQELAQRLAGVPSGSGGRQDSLEYLVDVPDGAKAGPRAALSPIPTGTRDRDSNPLGSPTAVLPASRGLPTPSVQTPGAGTPAAGSEQDVERTMGFSPDVHALRGLTPPAVDAAMEFDTESAHAFLEAPARAAAAEPTPDPAQVAQPAPVVKPVADPSGDLLAVAAKRGLDGGSSAPRSGGKAAATKAPTERQIPFVAILVVAILVIVAMIALAAIVTSGGEPAEAPSGETEPAPAE